MEASELAILIVVIWVITAVSVSFLEKSNERKRVILVLCLKLPIVLCLVICVGLPIITLLFIVNCIAQFIALFLNCFCARNNPHRSRHMITYPMDFGSSLFFKGASLFGKGKNMIVSTAIHLESTLTTDAVIQSIAPLYLFPQFCLTPRKSPLYFAEPYFEGTFEDAQLYIHASTSDDSLELSTKQPMGDQWWNQRYALIERHIREHTFNGTNISQFQKLLDEIRNSELDKDIPWWDLHVIHHNCDMSGNDDAVQQSQLKTKSKYRYASGVLRFHHCTGDGVTLLNLVMPQCLTNDKLKPITLKKFDKSPKIKLSKVMFGVELIESVLTAFQLAVALPDDPLPIFNKFGDTFGNHRYYHRKFDFRPIKQMCKTINQRCSGAATTHVSINDLLTSLTAGAVRRTIIANCDAQKTMTVEKYLAESSVISLMMAALPDSGSLTNVRNNFILVATPFPINISESLDRTLATTHLLAPFKRPIQLGVIITLYRWLGKVSSLVPRAVLWKTSVSHTLHYSSMCGPLDKTICFGGVPIVDREVHVADTGTPVVELFTCGDELSVNITCNEQTYAQAQQWGHLLKVEIDTLTDTINRL